MPVHSLTLSIALGLPSLAETFGVRVVNVCPAGLGGGGCVTDASGNYQAVDLASLHTHWTDALYEASRVFQPAGISFQLTSIEVLEDKVLASLDDPSNDESTLEALLWPEAEETPDLLTIFQLPRVPGGFSVVPCTADSGQRQCQWFDPSATGPRTKLRSLNVYFPYDGSFVAHEIGHHFCLPHTHTGLDFNDTDWILMGDDGDGFLDTPPDPSLMEKERASGAWVDESTLENHHWCRFTQDKNYVSSVTGGTACEVDCQRTYIGGTVAAYGAVPNPALVMSCYMPQCTGPVNGNANFSHFSPFTASQVGRMGDCLTTISERRGLVDICASLGGDTDNDGICDDEDTCPWFSTIHPTDIDGDGFYDGCDLCPLVPSTQADIDNDGVGDECDPDSDNDGCFDTVDLEMLQPGVQSGDIVCGCALIGTDCQPEYLVGLDSDSDGTLDCSEVDPDGDGLIGSADACPLDPDPECMPKTTHDMCGSPNFGKGFIKVSIIPEDCVMCAAPWASPEKVRTDLDWAVFDGATGRIYAVLPEAAPATMVAARILGLEWASLAGGALSTYDFSSFSQSRYSGGFLPGLSAPGYHDVLVTDATTGERIGSTSASAFSTGTLSKGRFISLDLRSSAGSIDLEGAWGFGVPLSAPLPDEDLDGHPDLFDNCSDVHNPAQTDRDGDHFGDGCDADFDQDGLVGTSDLRFAESCLGVVVRLPWFHPHGGKDGEGDEGEAPVDPPPSSLDAFLAQLCAPVDMDEDGEVGASDIAEVGARLGEAPGPSAWSNPTSKEAEPTPEEDDTAAEPPQDTGDGPAAEGDPSEPKGRCGCATPSPQSGVLALVLLVQGLRARRRGYRCSPGNNQEQPRAPIPPLTATLFNRTT